MQKELWERQLVESLRDLGNTDLQQRAWVGRAKVFLPGPVELICQVFDDSGVGDLLLAGAVFTPEIDSVLRALGDLAHQVDLSMPPDHLLKDKYWLEVARLAAAAASAISSR